VNDFIKNYKRGDALAESMDSMLVFSAMQILRHEVKKTSLRRVAARLAVSPATVALALSGKDPANYQRLAARVLRMIEERCCAHTGTPITPAACQQISGGRAPTHHPAKLEQWKTCRNCQYNSGDNNAENS
jgi:hypothetical protein